MTSGQQIAAVALMAGAACSLAGVFLVLRRMAMMADAISHAILPGLVAGYVLAHGPNLWVGFLGATAAGLATVWLVEVLAKSRRVREDTAIGLVFPTMFALGVLVVSKFFANVHIDTDAVLYGEIAMAPFDRFRWGGHDLGPLSLWVLSSLFVFNAVFLTAFYKEFKLSTFDAGLAACLGFAPAALHMLLMTSVAITTVGAFSAVGAVLSVALIIVPPVTASLLTERLPILIGLSGLIGALGGVLGYVLAAMWDVSISGMIATTLGAMFFTALLGAPRKGILSQLARQRQQRLQFAVEMLAVHLATHEATADRDTENSIWHLERELGWSPSRAASIVRRSERAGYVLSRDGQLQLTEAGHALVETTLAR
ncbi:MAG: metal ABC transporter permease [Chthonomonas sp.]|nr:metal ABC transporter permease [Chthonomonas sp.]